MDFHAFWQSKWTNEPVCTHTKRIHAPLFWKARVFYPPKPAVFLQFAVKLFFYARQRNVGTQFAFTIDEGQFRHTQIRKRKEQVI